MKRTHFSRKSYLMCAVLLSLLLLTAYSKVNCDRCDPTICNQYGGQAPPRYSLDSSTNLAIGDSRMAYFYLTNVGVSCCKSQTDFASVCIRDIYNQSIHNRAAGGARLTRLRCETDPTAQGCPNPPIPVANWWVSIPDQYCRATRVENPGEPKPRWDYDAKECSGSRVRTFEWVVASGGGNDITGGSNGANPHCAIDTGTTCDQSCDLMLQSLRDVVYDLVEYIRVEDGSKVILLGEYLLNQSPTYTPTWGWYNDCISAADQLAEPAVAALSAQYGDVFYVDGHDILTSYYATDYTSIARAYSVDGVHPSVETTFAMGDGIGNVICEEEQGQCYCCTSHTNCGAPNPPP
jgi:hypothetical protein